MYSLTQTALFIFHIKINHNMTFWNFDIMKFRCVNCFENIKMVLFIGTQGFFYSSI